MPVAVVAPDDGVVAWLLRDYENTEYLTDPNDALEEECLPPATFELPEFDQGYVGRISRLPGRGMFQRCTRLICLRLARSAARVLPGRAKTGSCCGCAPMCIWAMILPAKSGEEFAAMTCILTQRA